jgi:serine/threonine protein kinase
MGRVYLARSAGGRPVAVKVIREDLADDPEFRARFRREVAAARRVNGLFTAAVADADTDGPIPWLATAFVPGLTLAQAVTEHGPLTAEAARALAAGLAEGLAAVHAAGVVHRDLKPSNVLLADDGPRLIDFGISRQTETGKLTSTGLVVGSPGFMSPEQAEGGMAGPPSDVFSLGAVLVYAATGHGPFGGGSTAALVYRVVHAEPELDDVPETIRRLVGRCLSKNAAMRPTAAELLDALSGAQPEPGWLPGELAAEAPVAPVAPVAVEPSGPREASGQEPKTVTATNRPPVMPETMPDTGLGMLDAVMSAPAPEALSPTTRDVVLPPPPPSLQRLPAMPQTPPPSTHNMPGSQGATQQRPVPPMPMPDETQTAGRVQPVPPMPWPGVTAQPAPGKSAQARFAQPGQGPGQGAGQGPGPGQSQHGPVQQNWQQDRQSAPPPQQYLGPPPGTNKKNRRLVLAGGAVAVVVAASVALAFTLTGGASTRSGGDVLSNKVLTPTRALAQTTTPPVSPASASATARPTTSHTSKPKTSKPKTSKSTTPASQQTTPASDPSTPATHAAKPKPSHSSGGSAARDLGAPNFSSWCEAQGDSVQLTVQNVSGWVCVTSAGNDTDINVTLVCIDQYNDPYAQAEYRSYGNANSWYCESS